jgi:trimethylamine--corrinoid protein Co-methyltransferase
MKPQDIRTFQPRLSVLSREQAKTIHASALEILEQTGFKMGHPEALAMLADAGCKVSHGDWVRLPASLVEDALRSGQPRVKSSFITNRARKR